MIIKKHKFLYPIFFILIIILSFISFFQAFSFGFIIDDWALVHGITFNKPENLAYTLLVHPIVAYEFKILAPLFGSNPLFFNMVGFVLKILGAFSVSLMVFGLTRSFRVSIFSGLILASASGGLEAFTRAGAHNFAFVIPFICLSIYFACLSFRNNSLKFFLISLSFLTLAILADPGMGAATAIVLVIFELLNMFRIKENAKLSFKHLGLLTFLLVILKLFAINRSEYGLKIISGDNIRFILENPLTVLHNYLSSIGNFLIGWIYPFHQVMGGYIQNPFGIWAGIFFIFLIVFFFINYLNKKGPLQFYLLFFSIWILFFYFPGWIYGKHLVAGGLIVGNTYRYFAISSVGLSCILGYLLSCLKSSKGILLLIIIIVLNLWTANATLSLESKYRSVRIQERLYKKISDEIPKGQSDNLLMFVGKEPFRTIALEWNGAAPLVSIWGLTRLEDLPKIILDIQSAEKLICKEILEESAFSIGLTADKRIPLSHLYVWESTGEDIINVSNQFREFISKDKNCQF